MKITNLFFNSITVSLPKNTIQFAFGTLLFWLIFGPPNISLTITALIGFVFTYSSVYMYNDIVDFKVDKKDREKLRWKLIASGNLSMKKAKYLVIFFALIGLLASFFVNKWFLLIMIVLLLMNFLHSWPVTRFKNNVTKTSINMTVIEFLKYSTGWFALTSNISLFPFWLVLSLSFVYSTGYMLYKFKFVGSKIRRKKMLFWIFGLISACSYIISIFLYSFPFSLIFSIILAVVIFIFSRHTKLLSYRTENMMFVGYVLLSVFMLSFLILMNPVVAEINDKITDEIHAQKEKISEKIPEPLRNSIENISNELKKYKSLDDIVDMRFGIE